MDRKEVKKWKIGATFVCEWCGMSVWGRWMRDTGVCWGHRGEGTGGGGAIITGSNPPTPPSSSSTAARWHTLKPQWRKQHAHTHTRTHMHIWTQASSSTQALQKFRGRAVQIQFQPANQPRLTCFRISETKAFPSSEVSCVLLQAAPHTAYGWLFHPRYQRASCCHWNVSPYGCRDT